MSAPLRLEVLHVPGCPNLSPLLERLREITALPVATREVASEAEADAAGMSGSPTLLVDGADPFVSAPATGGLSCRIYRDEHGRTAPIPTAAQLRVALAGVRPASPQALDPAERAVHRAVLRTFAETGRPPAVRDLAPLVAGRDVPAVLAALHDRDAIRLAPDGRIAVAYPFSARPTRHRVRIEGPGGHVDVFAMCAIDALGIAPMLGVDTTIDSFDVTSGAPIIIAMVGGSSRWSPPGAVAFVGAEACAGPSAERCCDFLNFFADPAAAHAWRVAHPHVPGKVLAPADAEAYAAALFGPLLTEPAHAEEPS